jgi:hypothetical protein
MSNAAAKRERVEQILGELAELGLMLARDLAAEARGAETPEQKVALAGAFQKTSRTVRLTLALDAKLTRDAAREDRDAAKADEAAHVSLTRPSLEETQKRRVKGVLNRLLWNEAESDQEEYEVLLEDLDARLHEAQDAPGFADLPIEILAKTLAADMRLTGELVVTTAATVVPANTSDPPLADTG